MPMENPKLKQRLLASSNTTPADFTEELIITYPKVANAESICAKAIRPFQPSLQCCYFDCTMEAKILSANQVPACKIIVSS